MEFCHEGFRGLCSGIGIGVDVVDGSITIVLDNSVAGGDSEEALVFCVEWLHLFGLDGEFSGYFIFIMFVNKFVKDC